jgi:DNA polymerase-4
MWQLANCVDPREVEPTREAKSLGNEETYAVDLATLEDLSRELLAISVKVAARLRAEILSALTVTVKARDHNFVTFTRSKTLNRPFSGHGELHRLALELFPKDKKGPWRLLGVSASHLVPADSSLAPKDLFEASGLKAPKGQDKLSEAMDAINNRFGPGLLKPATLLDRPTNIPKYPEPSQPDHKGRPKKPL